MISGCLKRRTLEKLNKKVNYLIKSLRVKRNKDHGTHNHHNIALGVITFFWIGTLAFCFLEIIAKGDCLHILKHLIGNEDEEESHDDLSANTAVFTFLTTKIIFIIIQVTLFFI